MCYSIAKLTEVNMKITYTIDKTKFANMIIAKKDKISTKAKTLDAPLQEKAIEDLEMC